MMMRIATRKGFTLIELIVAVAIMTVLMAIVVPGMQDYTRTAARAATQQEMLRLAEQLERHKARNFTYSGFDAATLYPGLVQSGSSISFPVGATGSAIRYTISFVDLDGGVALNNAAALGRNWAITAIKINSGSQAKNYDLLLTSTGIRCMTPVTSTEVASFTGCGVKSENW